MPVEIIRNLDELKIVQATGNGAAIESMAATIRSLWRRFEGFIEASDAGLEIADIIPDGRDVVAVVLRVKNTDSAAMQTLASTAAMIAAKFGEGVFALIATEDARLETMDENFMREHGWVRAAPSVGTKGDSDA